MMESTMEKTTSSKSELYTKVAGCLLFLAGVIAFMGIITGEIFYPPGYSTATNEISDLGASQPLNSLIFQPSATIFNTTMIIIGVMIITGAYFVQLATRKRILSIPLLLVGIGALGVGIFPGNIAVWHRLFTGLTFISGGITAILSARVISGPYRYISICLGAIALVALAFANKFIPILGSGGTERWVAYPELFWLTGFGGYLLGQVRAPKTMIAQTNEG